MPRTLLPNFSKGEVASDLHGRVDTGQYSTALKTARNWIVLKYGGITFRPGTRMVGKWDDPGRPLRLIPFQFSIDQAYVLAMGQGIMRPVARGGFVVEQNTQITGITLGSTTTLTIPFHGYSVGDRLIFEGIEGTVELNNRFVEVVGVPNANTITLGLDSTGFGAFVSSDGTLNVGAPPAPPAPPVVPPVVNPPPPPDVGGGGGYDYDWRGRFNTNMDRQ